MKEGAPNRLAYRRGLRLRLCRQLGWITRFTRSVWSRRCQPGRLLPWCVHRTWCCEQTQGLPTSLVLPPQRHPPLRFVIKGKPERRERPAGVAPSEAALAKCRKADLPCQIGLDITIYFQLMKRFFLFRFLSWESHPGVLISDPIFLHLLTPLFPPSPTRSFHEPPLSIRGTTRVKEGDVSHEALTLKHGH